MTSNFHFGDSVTQYGDHNTGMIKNSAPANPQVALQELLAAVRLLREQVPAADRELIDDSLSAIGTGEGVPAGTLRRALGNIAGIAAMVGQVGVPVVESVQRVLHALGV